MSADMGVLRIGEFAEAARRALAPARPTVAALEHIRGRLHAAARAYDETAVHPALDQAPAGFGLETALRELILPTLRQIGDQWKRGEFEVGEEHLAPLVLSGSGASAELCVRLGVDGLDGDLVAAAESVARAA